MASLRFYSQFDTNLMSNRKVITSLQLKSAKAHGKNSKRVRPPLVRHLLRNSHLYVKTVTNGRYFLTSINFLRPAFQVKLHLVMP